MASPGARIGVLGATGALGSEVLAVLAERSLRVREIVPVATDRSLGRDVEFQGAVYPVAREIPSLRELDLLFLCAPPGASLEFARQALRHEVPCIDLSGALAGSQEVPLRVARFGAQPEAEGAPLVATPAGAALAWALVLRPLGRLAGLRRVVGTLLDAASAGGRQGIEALFRESLALFNQTESPEPELFGRPVAFDCLPAAGGAGEEGGDTPREAELVRSLERMLGSHVRLAVTALQVPAFVGHGAALAIETERPLSAAEAEEALDKAPGVELWQRDAEGPTTRAATGREAVLVGRLRGDRSAPGALLLWLAADVLRLAAANAVEIAVARLRRH